MPKTDIPLKQRLNGSNGHKAVEPVRRKLGRPSLRTLRIEKVILGRISEGRSLQKICKSRHLPSYTTVTRWLQEDEDFRKKYGIARQEQAEMLASQLLEIADDGSNDTYKNDAGTFVNHDVINRSRLRIDTRKWIASKLLPKVYGEKAAEVNNNVSVHNYAVPPEKVKAIRERHAKALEGYGR